MNPVPAICAAAVAHLVPEPLAAVLRQSAAAWGYVAYGFEAMLLWMWLGAAAPLHASQPAVQAAAVWGAMEGAQRAACRLVYPMDRPPPAPPAGRNLCDLATGLPMTLMSTTAAAMACLLAAQQLALQRSNPWRPTR